MIHTVKGFGIVNKAEIDVFLELSCFFDDPSDVSNLISGSSTFSKTSLMIIYGPYYVEVCSSLSGKFNISFFNHTRMLNFVKTFSASVEMTL